MPSEPARSRTPDGSAHPMRVAHFFPYIQTEYGGPVRAVIDLCAALARRGHDTTLMTLIDEEVPEEWKRGGPGVPRVIVLRGPRRPMEFLSAGSRRHAREVLGSADLLHLHGVWNPFNVQLGRIARRAGVPYIVSVRGMLDDWCMAQRTLKKRFYLALAGRAWLERAAMVHLTAQGELDQAKKWFPRGRGTVIPNLLDLESFRTLPGPEEARRAFPILRGSAPTMLFLSRVHYKKGIEPLLRALRLMRDRGVAASLIIAGTGDAPYVESLRSLARELAIDEHVAFVGHVVGERKLSLYQAADLFVLPTSQENFGFVFVEALACGTPLVTTKGVDIWPELESSGGAVIEGAEPAALASRLSTMLSDRARLKEMGERGRRWVFDWLDPERVMAQFESMCRAAIGARPER